MGAEETVLAFVEAWNALDQDRIYALMSDGIVYHNIPLEPVVGLKPVRANLAAWPVDEAEWTVRNIAVRGDVVLTERVDRFRRGARWITVPVMGVFEVADGKITHWRDYFDMGALKPAPSDRPSRAGA